LQIRYSREKLPCFCAFACIEMVAGSQGNFKVFLDQDSLNQLSYEKSLTRTECLEDALQERFKITKIQVLLDKNIDQEVEKRIKSNIGFDIIVDVVQAKHKINYVLEHNQKMVAISWLDTTLLDKLYDKPHMHAVVMTDQDEEFVYFHDPLLGRDFPLLKTHFYNALKWIYVLEER
jgi:hypothetical protein